MSRCPLPRISDHGSEIILFGIIAVGVIGLLGYVIGTGVTGWDVAACLLVLQSIISAVKERWTQRSVDRMGQQLGASTPPGEQATGKPDDPVHTVEERP
jgi:hypothetical protein